MSSIVLCIASTAQKANTLLSRLTLAGIPPTDIIAMEVCSDCEDGLLKPNIRIMSHSARLSENDGKPTIMAMLARASYGGCAEPSVSRSGQESNDLVVTWMIPPKRLINPSIVHELYELGVSWFEASAIASEVQLGDVLILVDVDTSDICDSLEETFRQSGGEHVLGVHLGSDESHEVSSIADYQSHRIHDVQKNRQHF